MQSWQRATITLLLWCDCVCHLLCLMPPTVDDNTFLLIDVVTHWLWQQASCGFVPVGLTVSRGCHPPAYRPQSAARSVRSENSINNLSFIHGPLLFLSLVLLWINSCLCFHVCYQIILVFCWFEWLSDWLKSGKRSKTEKSCKLE